MKMVCSAIESGRALLGWGWLACEEGLYSTSDGGTTWSEISPRVRTRGGALTTIPVVPSARSYKTTSLTIVVCHSLQTS